MHQLNDSSRQNKIKMNDAARQLKPAQVWQNFADLNAIPRCSKKEERVRQFIKKFGESLGLPTVVDSIGNVIIKKPASPGMEERKTVVMQAHLDMVCQKNADTDFDFDKEGIRMKVNGDWVEAEGTTLGADNGIGVAMIMTLLQSDNIPHPPIEALFTIDEETGMTGALGLEPGELEGKILLNIDTEDDDELTIGCAGGIDITATASYNTEDCNGLEACKVVVRGLTGGHSGMDIHLGRANANKVMNRLLWHAENEVNARVAEIDGGGLRNAIPRESFAVVLTDAGQGEALKSLIDRLAADICAEFSTTDPDMFIGVEACGKPARMLDKDAQYRLLRAIYSCQNGIYRMSPDIPGLVQTSNNLARVSLSDGKLEIQCLTRSSSDSEKMDLAHSIQSAFELAAADVQFGGSYPGWQPEPGSSIVHLMEDLYREIFKSEPKVNACHAGLECGIIGSKYPGMEMISFGPNIRGAHSPDEKVQISSVQKSWEFLLKTLERIPKA